MSYIYASIGQIGFAYVDDKWMLLDEKLMQAEQFNWDFLLQVFTRINSLQYSPLNTLYYYLIYQINGYDPYYYHLFSFLIHVCNVSLIFFLLRDLLRIFSVSNAELLAYGVALMWAVLPFNVESVIWISASKIPLYTFFGLLSFMVFVKAFLKGNYYYFAFSLVLFTLSFLAKEQAVLFPLMMAAFIFAYQKKHNEVFSPARFVKWIGPFFVLSFLFGLITLYSVIYGGGSHDVARYPFTQRLVLSFYCICFYIFNTFIPFNLHYHYPFPVKPNEVLPFTYYIYPVLLPAILWQFFVLIKRNPNYMLYIFCLSIFIIHLLLCIQIVPLARAAMLADRYMYLPAIGLLLILAIVINEKFEKNLKQVRHSTGSIALIFSIYILFLTIYSHNLVDAWKYMQLK